jgi:phosphatidylserine decarboxylase
MPPRLRLDPCFSYLDADCHAVNMNPAKVCAERTPCEPLPENLRSVQPGGGLCYQVELAWGRLRRWYLHTFRPGYVRRMATLRQGDVNGAPHAILDPRDLKYCRNQCNASWPAEDDPFAWRERLPLARWGLGELVVMGLPLVVAVVALGLLRPPFWTLAVLPAVLLALLIYFFRDPPRAVPADPGLVVAPADGKVVDVTPISDDPFIGGPAVRIGIFLSIFNVHINRAPIAARVIRLEYRPGLFLNALRPESAIQNEALWIGLEEPEPPHRRLAVRQISGLIARRIVCSLRPGEQVERGVKFGMIKLGSRTELVLPAADLAVEVTLGATVKAGSTVLGRFAAGGQTREAAETP